MKIETKYNIDDEVWYTSLKGIGHDRISNIRIDIDCVGGIYIHYELWNDVIKEEDELFPTKEELLKSL